MNAIRETTLSQIWQEGWHVRELRTVDGRRVHVVYPGIWTHSSGPDFRDALVEIDGRLVHGSIELHLRSSDWRRHRHDAEQAYRDVILHVVLEDDSPGSASDGAGRPIATVNLSHYLLGDPRAFRTRHSDAILGAFGGRTCLPTLASGDSGSIRTVLRRKGWERLVSRQLRFEQEFELYPPAEALYRGLLDAMGLVGNRPGMRAVAEAVPLHVLESEAERHGRIGAAALLLGTGGFLPLSEVSAQVVMLGDGEIRTINDGYAPILEYWGVQPVVPGVWNLRRVRPANHPARRLASIASLVAEASPDGLLHSILSMSGWNPGRWQSWTVNTTPPIGASRTRQTIANVIAPFLAAYGEATGDRDLADRVGLAWERLPGVVDDSIARETLRQIVGEHRFSIREMLEEQGLHQIGRFGCTQLRCFECPIAALAIEREPSIAGIG